MASIHLQVMDKSCRATPSAFDGPLQTQCVLRSGYLRAIADRRFKSCPGSGGHAGKTNGSANAEPYVIGSGGRI